MKKISFVVVFTVAAVIACAQQAHHPPHWSYEGPTGPAHWADLSPDYSACKNGHEQSPIDIINAIASESPPIEFNYSPVRMKLIDNGHTVQVNYAPGSYVGVGGKKYELLQFHFHHPSEELINGKSHDLVIHLVHQDAQGHKAVVAVLFREGNGNGVIKTVVEHLPKVKEQEIATETTINAGDLLPGVRSYYTFSGSLTTPPCSEGVAWFVLRTPATISKADLASLAKLYPNNARPVQPLNGRTVRASR